MAKDLLKDSTFPDAWYDVAFEDGVAADLAALQALFTPAATEPLEQIRIRLGV